MSKEVKITAKELFINRLEELYQAALTCGNIELAFTILCRKYREEK